MRDEPIARVMTAVPATVSPTASVAAAERVMREHQCHHVPVVDGGRLIGMISSSDLLKALFLPPNSSDVAPGRPLLESRRAADIMQREPAVLPHTATVLDAAKALARGGVHAVPIVAPGHMLLGIVTSTDLIETLVDGLRHPAADPPPARPDRSPVAAQSSALRQVYKAARNYLESGRAEFEHVRLLQAVDRAREAVDRSELSI